jgi:hypothetical protein
MPTNILIAIKNMVTRPLIHPVEFYKSNNRVNNAGEALEQYIVDLFCGSQDEANLVKKLEAFSEYFSYLGNKNNPPDLMIRSGDAIEIKKITTSTADIALNSSYPKDKIYVDSPMLTKSCRECENWSEKDMLYVVGSVNGAKKAEKLTSLWMVYGDCYAAAKETYEKITDTVTFSLNQMNHIEFAETNELAKIHKIDPLGITSLRVRAMWVIKHPKKVFNYLDIKYGNELSVHAIILKNKYESFDINDRKNLEALSNKSLSISDVLIKSPNNPAQLLEAKLISYTI